MYEAIVKVCIFRVFFSLRPRAHSSRDPSLTSTATTLIEDDDMFPRPFFVVFSCDGCAARAAAVVICHDNFTQ